MTSAKFCFTSTVLECLRKENRHLFLYGPPSVGKQFLLTSLDERDRTEGKVRRAVDLRSSPNLNPADIWTSTEGLTIANADDPAIQLNDLYPELSAHSPGTRNARPSSISEEHPLRVSSVDSVRFVPSFPKKLVQRIERIFPAVRIYPLSYRECQGLTSADIAFSTDTEPSTFFPGANEQTRSRTCSRADCRPCRGSPPRNAIVAGTSTWRHLSLFSGAAIGNSAKAPWRSYARLQIDPATPSTARSLLKAWAFPFDRRNSPLGVASNSL